MVRKIENGVNMLLWILYGLICLLVSYGSGLLVIRLNIMDVPTYRSSHQQGIPTSGGLACAAGLFIGLVFFILLDTGNSKDHVLFFKSIFLGGIALFIGLWDDIFVLKPGLKFLLLGMISVCGVWAMGPVMILPVTEQASFSLPYWIAVIGTALWFFAVLNFVNFMDGANGLLFSVMMVAFFFLALIGFMEGYRALFVMAIGMSCVLLSFAFFNFRDCARLFSGDSGALLTGMIFALLSVYLAKQVTQNASLHTGLFYTIPLLIAPFFADTVFTLVWRISQKRSLLQAHKEHFYQLALRAGWPHLKVSILYGLFSLLIGGLALWMGFLGAGFSLMFLLVISIILSFIAYFIRKRAAQTGHNTPY